jgi:hypothetical protein
VNRDLVMTRTPEGEGDSYKFTRRPRRTIRPDDHSFPPLLGWLSDPFSLRASTQPQRVRGTSHGYVGLLGKPNMTADANSSAR